MDSPATQPFERTFEHSEELYRAALAEFSDAGYEQASINDILQAAGMSKGQFYYHFGSKEALYLSLIDIMVSRKRAYMAFVFRPEDLQQDLFEILKTQIRYGLDFAEKYPEINLFSESFLREQGNSIYETALQRHNFEDNDAIGRLIDLAHQRGELRKDLPLSFIKKAVGYLFTHAVDLTDMSGPGNYETNLTYLLAFMKSGLAADNSRPTDS